MWARLTGVFRLTGPAADPAALIIDGTLAEATVRAGTRTLRIQDPLLQQPPGGPTARRATRTDPLEEQAVAMEKRGPHRLKVVASISANDEAG